jgi:hypothetical protein
MARDREFDLFGDGELPFQSHSRSSRRGARKPRAPRVMAQEKWVYETVQSREPGYADFQLWSLIEHSALFDKLSSLHRARIGLVWVNRKIGATPYHPIEDSGAEVLNPETGVLCAVWRMKPLYRKMPYEQWVATYKELAHERHGGSE